MLINVLQLQCHSWSSGGIWCPAMILSMSFHDIAGGPLTRFKNNLVTHKIRTRAQIGLKRWKGKLQTKSDANFNGHGELSLSP